MSSSICPSCAPLASPDTRVADGTNGSTYACCLSAGKESDTIAETLDVALRSQDSRAEKSDAWILNCEGLDDLMFFVLSFSLLFLRPFLPLHYLHTEPTGC